MVAGQNLKLLAAQIREFAPRCVAIKNESDVPRLRKLLGRKTIEIGWGVKGAAAISTANEVDVVLAAIVGAAGLVPTLEAIRAGKEIALANKEALVMAGEILVNEAKKANSRLFPVDSEHSAIFQCLEGNQRDEVDKLILTASGGPFLKTPLSRLSSVTISQALKHPNWKMGQKITIDSATMMNKGLEVVEAHWEFSMEPSRIDVVIHPQSVVHSMVRYQDGTIIAQLGIPDMRIPIAYALAYPHRLDGGWKPLEVTDHRELNFLPVEEKRYPALGLAYDALKQGGTMPAVLNAANEIAVEAFLAGKIGFREIHRTIERTMCGHLPHAARDVEDVLDADRWARERATSLVH
jgi:1-deoxy-D-xylulose-5-phosphate reductoisomerase